MLDFIKGYVEYADVLEAPRAMHEFVAIQILATLLNANAVTIQHGANNYPLDLWIALLSESGGGRSTLVSLAEAIVVKVDSVRILPSNWGSPQAVYQGVAEAPCGLFVWGEMSEKLKQLNDRTFGAAKQWLTDRYDNFRIPDPISYRDTGRPNRNTPPIIFSVPPRLNILATSSEEWFFNNLLEEDSAGGFVPRWVIVRPGDSGKVVPTPQVPNQALVKPLADHLERVAKLSLTSADVSAILPNYDSWYREALQRFLKQPNSALARAYFNRHRVHILKLAVIYEVSCSGTLQVTQPAWERAVATAADLENTLFQLLPTAMSKDGYIVSRMEERVRQAGAAGLRMSEFTRTFQHMVWRDRHSYLTTLLDEEQLAQFSRGTGGRPAIFLVHKDFATTYSNVHPKDTRL
jgi:hypothetical protein